LSELTDLHKLCMNSQVNDFEPLTNVVNFLKPVEHKNSYV